ncbi:DUF397 domain-containing protein [Actinomadura sp. NPDC049753]|uniref:DUF397 domain-containing protein n=1 Tax=Actinomadura sp. NPDC049753 TaxID=3154739 RepID=UPI003413BC6F
MTTPPYWRKSSHSGGGEGNCVEIAAPGGHTYGGHLLPTDGATSAVNLKTASGWSAD